MSANLTQVFERGCAESRVRELTDRYISELALEDGRQIAKAQRLAGDPVTPYHLNQQETIATFRGPARVKAFETLEQDRKTLVDAKSPFITIVLKNCIRQLKNLLSEEGDLFFRRTFTDKIAIPHTHGPNDSSTYYSEASFTYDAYLQRASRFSEFGEYLPYLSEDLKTLWQECHDLSLEIARKELLASAKTQETAETEKTEKTETPC